MILTYKNDYNDQIKVLDKKNLQNEAQYDLYRKAAKISALPSHNLDKYEYLTGEDLGLKPSVIEQTKFEYYPLGKLFNKGLDEDDQKEELLKRLKNIENAQKKFIRGDDNRVFTTHLDQNLIVKMIKIKIKKPNKITT